MMFEIDVVSEPSGVVKADDGFVANDDHALITSYDEQLIKPALLVADRVNFVSMRADMLRFNESEEFKNARMPMRFIHAYAHLSMRADSQDLELLGISQADLASKQDVEEFLAGGAEWESLNKFGTRYAEQITRYQTGFAAILRRRSDDLRSSSMARAQQSGVLRLEPWLDEELGPFHLAWSDVQEKYYPHAVQRLSERLTSNAGVVMMDPHAQATLDMGRRLEPANLAGLDASAAFASSLTARLPGIYDLPLDEVLDLRMTLADHLAPFRSRVMEIGLEVAETAPSDNKVDLAKEIELVWHREIDPGLAEIREEIRKARYGRNLLRTVSESKAAWGTSVSSVVLAVGTVYAGLGALIPAAATAAFPFVAALNETLKSSDAVKSNRLYFLHRVQQEAQKARR